MPTTTLFKIYDVIISRDAVIQFLGAFFGAFFTFVLFIVFEKIKKYWKHKSSLRRYHHLIEKYLHRINATLEYNKGLVDKMVKDLNNQKANIMELDIIVIERELTSNISDLLLINRMEFFYSGLNNLKLSQDTFGDWKSRIVSLVDKKNFERVTVEVKNFSEQGKILKNILNLNIDITEDLLLENRVLLQKYNNWVKFVPKKLKKKLNTRKKKVAKARKEYDEEKKNNPFHDEYIEKLKKHELYDKK